MDGLVQRRKSSYSGGNGGDCVAVGTTRSGVALQDTKQDGAAGRTTLVVPPAAFRALVESIKR